MRRVTCDALGVVCWVDAEFHESLYTVCDQGLWISQDQVDKIAVDGARTYGWGWPLRARSYVGRPTRAQVSCLWCLAGIRRCDEEDA